MNLLLFLKRAFQLNLGLLRLWLPLKSYPPVYPVKVFIQNVWPQLWQNSGLGPWRSNLHTKEPSGRLDNELLYYDREPTLEIVTKGRSWSFDGESGAAKYLSNPFQKEPDFGVTSLNYDLAEVLERDQDPL